LRRWPGRCRRTKTRGRTACAAPSTGAGSSPRAACCACCSAKRWASPRAACAALRRGGGQNVSLGLPARGLRFTYGPHGKPAVASGPRFNLSHSDGQALFALSHAREVGIDIERVWDDLAVLSLAARWLPPPASAALSALPPAARPAAFCRAWVRHEASLKARGLGLAASGLPEADPARWTLLDLEVPPPYRATLAVGGSGVRIEWRDF